MVSAKEILKKRVLEEERLSAEAPSLYAGFSAMMKEYYKPSALSRKYKELMAVTASVATRCVTCFANHTQNAVSAGATREEVIDAAAVGVEFGGGPSFVFARDYVLPFLEEIAPADAKR